MTTPNAAAGEHSDRRWSVAADTSDSGDSALGGLLQVRPGGRSLNLLLTLAMPSVGKCGLLCPEVSEDVSIKMLVCHVN